MNRACAIIVAAGSGLRMGTATPKQFLPVGNRPVLYHTLEKFEQCVSISDIILVVHREMIGSQQLQSALPPTLKTPLQIVAGGNRRQDSVREGIRALPTTATLVAIHDGVRPFVNPGKIDETVQKCRPPYDGVILARPSVNTLKEVKQNTVMRTLNRTQIWQAHTPQTFRISILKKAFETLNRSDNSITDDASLVERIGGKILVIEDLPTNIKITRDSDLAMARALMDRES